MAEVSVQLLVRPTQNFPSPIVSRPHSYSIFISVVAAYCLRPVHSINIALSSTEWPTEGFVADVPSRSYLYKFFLAHASWSR